MWGLVPVKGVFREVTGQGTVSAAGEVSGAISVAAASIDTKMKKRDVHLRSKDFFDGDNFPAITFAVAQLTPAGAGVTVAGNLTVRDRTQPISFPAKVSVLGSGEVQLDAAVPVNRADFGLTWNQMGMASMANTITVHAVFRKR
jgi:polyisoprenoid-binding protein YceI